MITIEYSREKLSIAARGHANAERNRWDHDLVCAAVSTLMQGWAYAGTRTGHVMEVLQEHGCMVAQIDPDATPSEKLRHIFDGYVLGLRMVEENHPECVRILQV